MNTGIRRVGIGLIVLMLALIGQLTYLQLVRADSLNHASGNLRVQLLDLRKPRGPIITRDGFVLAKSVPVEDIYGYQRVYPLGPEFASVTGYQSILFGNTAVESYYNDALVGRTGEIHVNQLFARDQSGTVVLSLTKTAQDAARDALGDRLGSVVVLDTHTGAVVALYSNPTYDPNVLAIHDPRKLEELSKVLNAAPGNPLRPRAYAERYPPGSTFKVVTAGIAIDSLTITADTAYPVVREISLPLNSGTLGNFDGKPCGGTLAESFRISCNTTFGQVGLQLGEELAIGAKQWGINGPAPPLDVDNPEAVATLGPKPGDFARNPGIFARDAIGQAEVQTSPLYMAMVAESVATGGKMLVPHVMHEIRDADGKRLRRFTTATWRRVMTQQTAAILNQFMVSVVESGTGTAAQIPGISVAGKTGTAQTVNGAAPHAWFIGFAPADHPRYAIAVLVEHGGEDGFAATGGRVAAPIAQEVLAALLQPKRS